MEEIFIIIFSMIGIVAFSVSGAMTAIEKKMDILGVVILGLTTAIGGGVIRDIILGNTPPTAFTSPIYSLVAIIISVFVFLPPVRIKIQAKKSFFDIILLIMDSIGLGVFTVVGIQKAYLISESDNIYLIIFVGVVTGVGGGVLRDIFAGNTPYIFIKHFYASASLIGAIMCVFLWTIFDDYLSMITGAAVIMILRILAARYRWKLPKA